MRLRRFIDALVLVSAGLIASASVLISAPIAAVVGVAAGFLVAYVVRRWPRAIKHPYLTCVAMWLLTGLVSALLRVPALAVVSAVMLTISLFMVRSTLGGGLGTAFLTALLPYLASTALFETYSMGLSLDRYFPLMCSLTLFHWAIYPLYIRVAYAVSFGYLLGAYALAGAEKRPLTYVVVGVAGFYAIATVVAVSESGLTTAPHVAVLAAAVPLALAFVIIKALRL